MKAFAASENPHGIQDPDVDEIGTAPVCQPEKFTPAARPVPRTFGPSSSFLQITVYAGQGPRKTLIPFFQILGYNASSERNLKYLVMVRRVKIRFMFTLVNGISSIRFALVFNTGF